MIPVSARSEFCRLVLVAAVLLSGPVRMAEAAPAEAPVPPPPPAAETPYDRKLSRLAEIVGAVHYLRGLCGASDADRWRSDMQALLDSDTANEAERRQRLTAAFNRGYRSFAALYSACTPAAIAAEESYRNEGATLATEITGRFGN